MSFHMYHLVNMQDYDDIMLNKLGAHTFMCGVFLSSVNSFIVSSTHLPEIRESKFPFIKKKQNPQK